jgi:hypothetical protein
MEVLHNIIIEFGILRKIVWLIKMCLSETYSRACICKNLSDKFLIQTGLEEDVLSPFIFSFVLECPREPGWTELNETRQFFAYAVDVNIVGEKIVYKSTDALLDAGNEVGLEVNPEKN